ncbi:MAG: sensor histidine kinase [Variibacter sp.]
MHGISEGLAAVIASERVRDNDAGLAAPDRRWHDVLQALPVAVYMTDPEGRIIFYNEAAVALWGVRPEIGKSEFCGSWKLYWPDGTPLPHDQCPMAVALRERKPNSGMEAIAERPDGTRVPFAPYPVPLWDENGEFIGALNTLVDLSHHKRGEETALRLASAIESSLDAIVTKDRSGVITSWNRSAERLFGFKADEAIGKPVTILIPEDRLDEETLILRRILRGERIEHFETIRRRKDGSPVDVSLTISPIRNGKGEVIGASKIARDITERRQAEKQKNLLLREMDHRVKNLFTVASSIVSLSARTRTTPDDLVQVLQERLRALALAHQLTLPDLSNGRPKADTATTLRALLDTILSPFANGREEHMHIDISGPDVPISGPAVTSVALLLHELATNASKYGAFSSQSGSVQVQWTATGGKLALTWTERGGPTLDGESKSEGFGSLLARGTMAQLGGSLSREWREEGLMIHLSAPLDQLAAPRR